MRQVARAKQLADNHSRPVTRFQRARGHVSDVSRRDHGYLQLRRHRAAVDLLVLDQAKHSVEVLKERSWAKDEHVHGSKRPKAFLLGVESGNRASALRHIGANAAQEDDVPDTAGANGCHNRLALLVPFHAEVR